uniref:H15 domain-containing protein n=1 Tax=Tetradesmus obliquus TaxID=3088 RepID=A0A383VYD4_TETOB|eukprot:jgi/Sobl393_1/15148/SZX70221.1
MYKKHIHSYPDMVVEALVSLKDKEEGHVHGHGLGAIKHAVEAKHHDLPAHWEKRLSAAVKMMADKHELAHVPGHPGMFKMSKALQEKQARKTGPRKPKAEKKVEEPVKAKAPAKKKEKAPAKAKHPAKRAKKADAKVKA